MNVLTCILTCAALFIGRTVYAQQADTQTYPYKSACLFVCMDGIQFNTPTVFDNLIATGEMPVEISVFVGSGTVVGADKEPIRSAIRMGVSGRY